MLEEPFTEISAVMIDHKQVWGGQMIGDSQDDLGKLGR